MNLKNNAPEMKTIVETFLIEETIDLIHDNEKLDKWNEAIKELELEGQTQIIQKDKSPIPFMHLKTSNKNICTQLCPVKIDIKKYNITPIPVEILELVSLSVKEKYFNKIEIWYDDKSPDPFAIGIKGKWYSYKGKETCYFETEEEAKENCKDGSNNSVYFKEWDAQYYLIGKWADVKRSWAELKEIAVERFKAEKGNEFRKAIKEANRGLEDLEILAFDKFN